MDLAVLPDGRRAAHHPRGRGPASTTRAPGVNTLAGTHRRLPARRGGPAEHRDRPELRRPEQLGLPLLLAAAEHAGRRPGDAGDQRGRRARDRHARRTSRRSRARSGSRRFKLRRRQARPRHRAARSSRCPVDRGICCHVGGNIDFDGAGNLFLSTGDDTNPFASDGYVADRRARRPQPGVRRPAHRRQHQRPARQAAADQAEGRRRLHDPARATCSGRARRRPGPRSTRWACATRSASRSTARTDDVYLGDYSPDANVAEPGARARPATAVDARSTSPANYGWPYCVTPTLPYVDYDFATGTSGEPFNCAAPVNDSPHNTGLLSCRRSSSRRSGTPTPRRAEFPRARAPAASARWAARRTSTTPAPAARLAVPLAERTTTACRCSTSGPATTSRSFRLNGDARSRHRGRSCPRIVVDNPMDMEFGPDGALYVLEYGDGYFAENPDAQLVADRLRPAATTRRSSKIAATRPSGTAPLTVSSPAPARPTRTATSSATRGTSTPTARSTAPPRTRRYTLHGERHLPRDAEGDRPRPAPRPQRRPTSTRRSATRRRSSSSSPRSPGSRSSSATR